MPSLFELVERGEAVQIEVEFFSDWIAGDDRAEARNSELLRIAQAHAVSTLIVFAQTFERDPRRFGFRGERLLDAQYRLATDFGEHVELGSILIGDERAGVRLSLLRLDVAPGSAKGKLIAGVSAVGVFLGGMYAYGDDIKAEMKFRETVNRSTCATRATASFTWHQHVEDLINGLPQLSIPRDMEEAQRRSHLPPDDKVCAFQSMLSAEHMSGMRIDGRWGPGTYAAWQDYKARNWSKGATFDDQTALKYLVRDARNNKAVYVALLNIKS